MTAPVQDAAPGSRTTVHRRPLSFGRFVAGAQARGTLVVQPRMGFSDPALMRAACWPPKERRTRSSAP